MFNSKLFSVCYLKAQVKNVGYKTVVLPVVLYRLQMWSFTLKEENT
jgi:hypothetical protein